MQENHIFIENSGFFTCIYQSSIDVFEDISVGLLYLGEVITLRKPSETPESIITGKSRIDEETRGNKNSRAKGEDQR